MLHSRLFIDLGLIVLNCQNEFHFLCWTERTERTGRVTGEVWGVRCVVQSWELRQSVLLREERKQCRSLIHSASKSGYVLLSSSSRWNLTEHNPLTTQHSLEAKYSGNIPPASLPLVYHSFYLLNNVWITSNWSWHQLSVTYWSPLREREEALPGVWGSLVVAGCCHKLPSSCLVRPIRSRVDKTGRERDRVLFLSFLTRAEL